MSDPEGWALPMKGRRGSKAHYFQAGRSGYPVSVCGQHAHRPGFTPLAHQPLPSFCCRECLRYLAVPRKEGWCD